MKKEFANPEIVICRFDAEDIITASGDFPVTGPTAEETVKETLNISNTYVLDWANME